MLVSFILLFAGLVTGVVPVARFAAGYVRVSTRDQWATPERQRLAIESLASEMGWELVGVWEDRGVSGFTDPLSRPGFRGAVEALVERGGGVLVAWSLDRVTRGGPAELTRVLSELLARRVVLFTVRERSVFETLYAGGVESILAEVHATTLAVIAKMEREFTRQRTREAMSNPEVRRRMEEGLRRFYEERMGLRRPEGWLERAVELYRQGWSITQIAKKLGVSKYTVWRWLAQLGVHRPRHTGPVCPRCGHRMKLVNAIPPYYYCEHCGYEMRIRVV